MSVAPAHLPNKLFHSLAKQYKADVSKKQTNSHRDLLCAVQRRVPAGQQLVREAFSRSHRHPVYVKLMDLLPDRFYWFDEFTACAFREAVIDRVTRSTKGRLTISCSAFGEFQAQQHRLQHIAGKLAGIRVLTIGAPARLVGKMPRLEIFNSKGVLAKYRIVLQEDRPGLLFIGKEIRGRCLGLFTTDMETLAEIGEDLEAVVRGQAQALPAFDRLCVLHETTQRIARELEDYSRRMELAIARAHRRPDLLTPARFDRIVRQSIDKLEQLKKIPSRVLRALDKR